MHPYLPEQDLVPFSENYRAPTIDKYYRKGFLNQHIYCFHLLIGNVMENDLLMIILLEFATSSEELIPSLHLE